MKKFFSAVILPGVLLVFSACAKMQPEVSPGPAQSGEKMIALEASSYAFTPNNIKAEQGDTIVFEIANVSGRVHNFSINDPKGKTLQNVDLPPEKKIPVTVMFPDSGTYEFYCDKPLHSAFGMKGQVVVSPR